MPLSLVFNPGNADIITYSLYPERHSKYENRVVWRAEAYLFCRPCQARQVVLCRQFECGENSFSAKSQNERNDFTANPPGQPFLHHHSNLLPQVGESKVNCPRVLSCNGMDSPVKPENDKD